MFIAHAQVCELYYYFLISQVLFNFLTIFISLFVFMLR